MQAHDLLPRPRSLDPTGESWSVPTEVQLALVGESRALEAAAARLERGLQRAGRETRRSTDGTLRLLLRPGVHDGEAYGLSIGSAGIELRAGSAAGMHAAACTLLQVFDAARRARAPDTLPGLHIEDRPDFAERGVLLDVSRSRVPRMETLFELVELFSSWKINRLQLYTEHTFAYRDHEPVWRGASPITAEEIRALDRFCLERCVELVPNQQSFGHFHRWLHHPAYRHLAECPAGVEHPFSREREPFSLCATDPRTLELLAGLYDELLGNFTSRSLHTGLDETFDLGWGRSKEACDRLGKGRVFMDFFREVHGLVQARGHSMQFWADVLLEHPERLADLPPNVHACLWGYEDGHPFESGTQRLTQQGTPFTVCPGTSSWQSLAGRTANMRANITQAVQAAAATDATGLLITDWGDRGHLQPLPASYPAWALFADLAWWAPGVERAEPDRDALAAQLDRHVFDDPGADLGRAVLDLGSVGESTGAHVPNASVLFRLLFGDERGDAHRLGLTLDGLQRGRELLDRARSGLRAARPGMERAELCLQEWHWAADLLEVGLEFGRARLGETPEIDLGARLERSVEEHAGLWRERSRPGGRGESLRWLEEARDLVAPARGA